MFNKKSISIIFSALFMLEFIVALVKPISVAPIMKTETAVTATAAKMPSLLQYTAGGHVLGFDVNKVYLAGLDHALSVEFIGGRGNVPVGVAASTNVKVGKAPELGQVTYHNVWSGVDVIYNSIETGLLESTYVVQPGAHPEDIHLRYNIPVQLQENGSLLFAFDTGTLTESAPIAFQEIAGRRVPVSVNFVLGNEQVSFAVGKYDTNYMLTIDPTYTWHTFYGSSGNDTSSAITRDGNGNFYVAGTSDASWSGPNSVAPLNAFSGVQDIMVTKLNSLGEYQWHTFYGSVGSDSGLAITSDGNGIYVAGNSSLSWNGPSSAEPLNEHSGGGYSDIVVFKLNNDGVYQWHTFYGSSIGRDEGAAITNDRNGNIYVTGISLKTWNGPGGVPPLDPIAPEEEGELYGPDIVVVKLDSMGVYRWHTFYGSYLDDFGSAITSDESGNIYVTGLSENSWNGPNSTPALHSCQQYDQIVVVKLNDAGAYQWHTCYGSSLGVDWGYAITSDEYGIYVAGHSTWSYWKGPQGHDPLNGGSGYSDLVVLKLSHDGEYQWHTFYGTDEDEARAIYLDGNGNLYVVGNSWVNWNGLNSMPLNPHSSGTNSDILILKLDSDGEYKWHAFYGSTSSDKAYAITSDENGNVVVAGTSSANWVGEGNIAPLHGYVGGSDAVVAKLMTNDDLDTVCENVPLITPGYSHFDILSTWGDIDPYKFEVTKPYTTIEATLTPPATGGDFVLSLFKDCDGSSGQPWEIARRAVHIGRRAVHIGGEEDPNIYVRFNVGKTIGTYYLTVQASKNGSESFLPYQLRVNLTPPDFTMVDTLILYNPTRFKAAYGLDLEGVSQMMDELTRLAEHPKVNGLIIQLDQFPAVATAYTDWDNAAVVDGHETSYSSNVNAANAVSDAIRVAMREYMVSSGQYITDIGYVVIVGDDDQIPYRRLAFHPPLSGDINWSSERDYFEDSLDDAANTPIDAALMADKTLSDNFYGDYKDRGIYEAFPSLAVGRLLDTPERIQNMIESFLEHNGVIDLGAPDAKAAMAGYDFLADAAQQICDFLPANGGLTTDCTLIDTPAHPNKFTAAQLSQKFIGDAPNVAGFYGHTNHAQLWTPMDPLTSAQIKQGSFGPSTSLWWVIGCQSGLVLPKSENFPLSLTQALGDHGVTYLGNTGWAWGSDGPQTYSELLYRLVANQLRTNQSGIGEALRLAKRDYFLRAISNAEGQGDSDDYYDGKVISEATLYGLPMLKFTFPGAAPQQSVRLPSTHVNALDLTSLTVPSNFHTLLINPDEMNHVPNQYGGNTYYTNQFGEFGATSGSPLLPQEEVNFLGTSLGRAKGVIWKGGAYTIQTGNNPLVILPTPLNTSPGAEPAFNGTYPLLPVAMVGLENLDGTYTNHLAFQTGQYLGTETNGTLRLFDEMEFLVGLWNGVNNDETSPVLGPLTSMVNGNTLHIELPITDSSGIYKAYVTFTKTDGQAINGSWQSQELTTETGACTTGQHTYSINLPFSTITEYFIQVMDCRGNVAVNTDNGQYYRTSIETIPVLSVPADNEVLLHRRPTFDWSDTSNASSYQIIASKTTSFSTPLWKVNTTTSMYTPAADLPAGKAIYWRVRAKTGGVWGPWSATWSFTTARPPSIPVLVSPANKAVTKDYTPLLNWNDSTVPSGGAAFSHYEVQIDTDKLFTDPVLIKDDTLTTSSYTPGTDLNANSRYFWRVRAFNEAGQYSSWSTVWSFWTALLPPSNLMPQGAVTVSNRRPALYWDAVAGASGYSLQISTSSSFATLLVNTTVTTNALTPLTKLPANTLIYWRVRATGTNGPSRWTTASFYTP